MDHAPARGFVLSRRERGEADLLLELILEDGSLRRAVAPSGMKSSRRFAGGLSPFTLYRFVFGRARSSAFVRLDEAVVERAWPSLLGELRRTAAAGVSSAIAREAIREGAGDLGAFERLHRAFEALSAADATRAGGVLVWFAMAALLAGGEEIVMDRCTRCGRRAPDGATVQFSPTEGGVVCSSCGGARLPMRAAERAALRRVIDGDWDAFIPSMLPWVHTMAEARLGKAGAAFRSAMGYW